MEDKFKHIPSVNVLLQSEEGEQLVADFSREATVDAIRIAIEDFRQGDWQDVSHEAFLQVAREQLEIKFAPSLKRTINATGTILHTNLGRSRLSPVVQDALNDAAFSYSNLEYDLNTGGRGSRYQHLESVICELTGAEAALVVNNNAAAVMLVLSTLAKGSDVIVSRGELVEIGGSFRVPEIIELSGCHLKEVGTTNKTHAKDYENAIFPEQTAGILKVHTSNYKVLGFTKSIDIPELAEIAHQNDLPLIHDMGSGMFIDLQKYGYPFEWTVQASLAAGADIVTFSGDKVLGGPQAGIIVGKKTYIDAMKKNQLTRALRVDKMTMATLEATLRLYYDEEQAIANIPTLKMLVITADQLEERAQIFAEKLNVLADEMTIEIVDTGSQVGGGSYPGEEIPSKAVAIVPKAVSVNQLVEKLRQASTPIVAKIRNDKCELDMRTLDDRECETIVQTLEEILKH